MRPFPKAVAILAVLAVVPLSLSAQQDKSKRPSPPGSAECKFADGKTVHIDYSRPKLQDPKTGAARKIYGGLVPYDKVWRTGANEAATFVTTASLHVGSADVPAGNYTLYTLPGERAWKLIISKKTGQWGIPYPGEAEDLARADMKVEALPNTVEQFTISFDQSGPDTCRLKLDWEKTRASVDIREQK